MRIYQCARCAGCGYVAEAFRWETPWTRMAADPGNPANEGGALEAQPCRDCGGTGALIELEYSAEPESLLPTRRGLPRPDSYARHVETVLQFQRGRAD